VAAFDKPKIDSAESMSLKLTGLNDDIPVSRWAAARTMRGSSAVTRRAPWLATFPQLAGQYEMVERVLYRVSASRPDCN